MLLLPKTFKRLDRSKCAQVVMSQVPPCNWSLLPSTVLSVFSCVLFHCMCSDTHAQVSQESPGVLPTPQLVPPPQDCCAFQLVPLCTISTGEATSRHMWLLPSLNICHAHHIYMYVLDLRFYWQLFVKVYHIFLMIFCLYMTFV